ncbi:class I SAM-dependent methyltransferase [Terribacillus halophilus]|uniref:class I SAM-dependent methyltransferase n=1 Tax=Terribacillus halophilus TaxID=361279 RepID=UPI0009878602|nr:class I SAM-dependent methyltransferase [Terribacillus halophilus]
MLTEAWTSRFFTREDRAARDFVLKLPDAWWSRGYEYKWAASFVEAGDIVLDAASGISHPFKFHLAATAQAVYACDIDARIMDEQAIIEDISRDFGKEEAARLPAELIQRIYRSEADLTALPYEDALFDKIFCISVIEHLDVSVQKRAWEQFSRTLKPGGLVILTFDYPTVDLNVLKTLAELAGLEFAGDVQTEMPANALFDDQWGRLYCFRAIFRKKKPPSI